MTDTPNREWDQWQAAWHAEAAAPATATAAELQRRLVRHHRAAWIYTALDVCAAIALGGLGVCAVIWRPTLPVIVWAASVIVFTAILVGFSVWNRRDALWFSARPTTDFLALLRVRLARRERLPRFLAWFVAAEIAFGLAFFAVWAPDSVVLAAALYGAIALLLAAWWWWYHKRLRRERVQLDALSGDDPGTGPASAGDR
jgi:O-antigen/teichoic acid export membrane protein